MGEDLLFTEFFECSLDFISAHELPIEKCTQKITVSSFIQLTPSTYIFPALLGVGTKSRVCSKRTQILEEEMEDRIVSE